MAWKHAVDLKKLKQSIIDIAQIFDISSDTLLSIMVGCAARGKSDWTRDSVIHVIRMIKSGRDSDKIINDMMLNRVGSYLN
jgi:hypothetical protein